jgi:hypothetical protein
VHADAAQPSASWAGSCVSYSRWQASAYTYGPVGRVVATVLVAAPVVYGLVFDIFFLIAGSLLLPVAVVALRHIWAPVPIRRSSPAVPPFASPAHMDGNSILKREGARRW